jgi:hypothetical protein
LKTLNFSRTFLTDIVYIVYIIVCCMYTACAHAKKNFFFVEFIELIRSIQNLFEFCKSDENWAQLQALKLWYFDVLKFWCSWCSSLAYLFFFVCGTHRKKISTLAKNMKNIKILKHQKISTSKLVTELSFHLICKIQTDYECYESAQ